MRMAKCPRCELNYMRPGENLCDVCKREISKKHIKEDPFEICPSCNEHPVVPGEELCKFCLREKLRLENAELLDDDEEEGKDSVDVDLEEEDEIDPEELADIDIEPLDDEIPEGDLSEIDSEFETDEEEDTDEDEMEEGALLYEEQ